MSDRSQHNDDYCPECGQEITYKPVPDRAPGEVDAVTLTEVCDWLAMAGWGEGYEFARALRARFGAGRAEGR